MTPSNRWDIPRPIWTILLSWGLAVLMIAVGLSFWIWSNQRDVQRAQEDAERQKDQAMCVMLDLFTSGPEPVSGPAGDRGRQVVAAMTAYRLTLRCESLPR